MDITILLGIILFSILGMMVNSALRSAAREAGRIGENLIARKTIGARYSGLYSGRHATGTQLTATTGNASASHQALGNTYRTSVDNYVHPVTEAGDAGLRLPESQLLAEVEKAKAR